MHASNLPRLAARLKPPAVVEFQERFFRSGTLRIHFRDWGNAEAPPLVIVHGLRDHSHSFDDLARGLRDRFHVLALDLRGHGDSETTPWYAFGHFVFDLHNLVRALRLPKPIVVGHSFGGELVGQWAGLFPDVPKALVIIEGLGPPPPRIKETVAWQRSNYQRIDQALAGPPGLPDLEAAYRRLRERNPRLTEERARSLALLGTRAREDGTLEWKFDPMLVTLSITGRFDLDYLKALWSNVKVPTLVLHGAESGEFWRDQPGAIYLDPEDLAARLSCFQDVRFAEIAGAGHMIHFDQPTALVTAIHDFLGEI